MPQDMPSMPPNADRVVISVSPMARSKSTRPRVDRLADLLAAEGMRTEVLTDLIEVSDLANRWHCEGRLRALVGVGGDGTAAELVNRTLPGVPLTMLPAGNENLLARHLNLQRTPEGVCRTVCEGAAVRLDAGKANDRVFLLMIGCGFDAEVVRRVHHRREGHVRNLDYFKPILQTVRSYQYPQLRIYWDDEDIEAEDVTTGDVKAEDIDAAEVEPWLTACWLFAFNLPCYGGGLRLAPQADGSDGLLDVCAFRRGSLWHGLRYAAAVLLGYHQAMADCTERRVRRLRIDAEAEVPYQLDGDPGGVLPVEVGVLPGRLTVVVPACEAPRHKRNGEP